MLENRYVSGILYNFVNLLVNQTWCILYRFASLQLDKFVGVFYTTDWRCSVSSRMNPL